MNKFKLAIILGTLLSCIPHESFADKKASDNVLTIGGSAAANKTLNFNIGNGTTNPKIRWNNSTSKIEFTNDGSIFKSIGSGSGSGTAGYELLSNPGVEDGATVDWNVTGGSLAEVTSGSNLLFDNKTASWDASATSQAFQSGLYTIPKGLLGVNCSARMTYQGGDANLKFQVVDGSSVVIGGPLTLGAVTVPTQVSVNFICPSSGSLRLQVASTANAAILYMDQFHLGGADNLSQISQAQFIGSGYYATTASCDWTMTGSTSFTGFPTTAACPGPTVEATGSGGWAISTTDTDSPNITVTNLPPGIYKLEYNGYADTSSGAVGALAVTDGTTLSGWTSFGTNAGSTVGAPFTSISYFTYSTAQSTRTFTLQSATSTGNVSIRNSAGQEKLRFFITRYPLASDTAYKADQAGPSWAFANHGTNCSWSTTSVSYVNPTDDGTCTFTVDSSKNLTLSSVGSVSPAITWTPDRLRDYEVCATVGVNNNTVANYVSIQMVDGSAVLIPGTQASFNDAAGNTTGVVRVCGILSASSLSALTAKIQIGGGGTARIQGYATASNAAIQWAVKGLDTFMGAPILVGSVMSNTSGQERIERATISQSAGSYSIASQSGSWLSSVTKNGTGDTTLTVAAGIFSAAPSCVVTSNGSATELKIAGTVTNISVPNISTFSSGGSASESAYMVHCMGPK